MRAAHCAILALAMVCMAGANKGVQNANKPNLLLLLLGPVPTGAFNGYLSPTHPLYNATGSVSSPPPSLLLKRATREQCSRAI